MDIQNQLEFLASCWDHSTSQGTKSYAFEAFVRISDCLISQQLDFETFVLRHNSKVVQEIAVHINSNKPPSQTLFDRLWLESQNKIEK